MLAFVQKERLVNVRLTPKTHAEFKIACELRGASMSSLLHQFIVRTIREEKEMAPKAFEPAVSVQTSISGTIQPELLPSTSKIRKVPHLGEIGEKKPQRRKKAS